MTAHITESRKPTCFVVMPISDSSEYPPGHFGRVYEHLLKPAITAAGFAAVRADDANKTDYIVIEIIRMIMNSEMVLCDLSGRNANVMYELGIRHAFNKPAALIKDFRTGKIFDIQGLRHLEYDESLRVDTVQRDIEKITSVIRETAKGSGKDVNSVVQLAGIIPAELPVGQKVSAEAQLILSALTSIERGIFSNRGGYSKFNSTTTFSIGCNKVTFSDNTSSSVGDEIWNGDTLLGTLVSSNEHDQYFEVRTEDGKVARYYANLAYLNYLGKSISI